MASRHVVGARSILRQTSRRSGAAARGAQPETRRRSASRCRARTSDADRGRAASQLARAQQCHCTSSFAQNYLRANACEHHPSSFRWERPRARGSRRHPHLTDAQHRFGARRGNFPFESKLHVRSRTSRRDCIYQKNTPTSQPQTIINNPIIERVVETVRTVFETGTNAAYVDERLAAIQQSLQSQIAAVAASSHSESTTIYQTLGAVARIENLDDINLDDSDITKRISPASSLSRRTAPAHRAHRHTASYS